MPFITPRDAAAHLLVSFVLVYSQLHTGVAAEHVTAALHRVQRSVRAAAGETETYLLVYDVSPDVQLMLKSTCMRL